MIFIFWVILSIISFFFSIKLLRKMQIKQTIYESGPTEHQKKSGTPTMGGVLIFFIFFTGVMILGSWNIPTIWIVFSAFLFFVIGVIDDMKSLRNKTNKGLSAKSKFILQLIVSLSLIFLLHRFIKPVSLLEVPLYVFLFTGASNATNLTDGVDGLLSGTMIISLLGVLFILFQIHSPFLFSRSHSTIGVFFKQVLLHSVMMRIRLSALRRVDLGIAFEPPFPERLRSVSFTRIKMQHRVKFTRNQNERRHSGTYSF